PPARAPPWTPPATSRRGSRRSRRPAAHPRRAAGSGTRANSEARHGPVRAAPRPSSRSATPRAAASRAPRPCHVTLFVRPWLPMILHASFEAAAACDEDALARLQHPEARIGEMPNAINTSGTERDAETAPAAFRKRKAMLASQSYEVHDVLEAG